MSNEEFVMNIVELIEKYRKEHENEFDHESLKIDNKNIFIHFHENETEIHIIGFNNENI